MLSVFPVKINSQKAFCRMAKEQVVNGNLVFGTMSIRVVVEAMGAENIPQEGCIEEVRGIGKYS